MSSVWRAPLITDLPESVPCSWQFRPRYFTPSPVSFILPPPHKCISSPRVLISSPPPGSNFFARAQTDTHERCNWTPQTHHTLSLCSRSIQCRKQITEKRNPTNQKTPRNTFTHRIANFARREFPIFIEPHSDSQTRNTAQTKVLAIVLLPLPCAHTHTN